ncbi:MAG: hypothetical protein OXC63_13545 [Aestuariivita sp.]|nr:hypothetical protein [Aestuariivita sp.]MCY4346206.1 hypothetical protein [Aestuariivita sp.]
MNTVFTVIVIGAILCVVMISTWISLRQSKNEGRGSLPGQGYNIIESNYCSGAGGGGHTSVHRVPKDPQEYAKKFNPRK